MRIKMGITGTCRMDQVLQNSVIKSLPCQGQRVTYIIANFTKVEPIWRIFVCHCLNDK